MTYCFSIFYRPVSQLLTLCTSSSLAPDVQNTLGVMGVHVVPTESLLQQMDAVLSDIGADVVKTGMLPNAAVRKRLLLTHVSKGVIPGFYTVHYMTGRIT